MKIAVVVPVKNRADLLPAVLGALVNAALRHGAVRIIVADNGSTDDSVAVAASFPLTTVVCSNATRVGGVRNAGARADREADVYAFIDSDCIVPEEFFLSLEKILEETEAAAVGCEVLSPADGHWSEVTWDKLHRPGGDGPRHYINSACFCIRRDWFERIGGFDEEKVSSEDVDICRRLAADGGAMWQSEQLAVLHLGNPKSIAGLYRRIRWHAEGVWEKGRGIQWSVTTAATFLHLILTTLGLSAGAILLLAGYDMGWTVPLLSFLATPLLFVAARAVQHRRRVPILGGMALMHITFAARLHGHLRSMLQQS